MDNRIEEHELGEPSARESMKSRHSSIRGPYRQGMKDTSFPYCNLVKTPDDTPDSYSRPLLTSGHGFPLWILRTDPGGPKNRLETAVRIGDIGVLDSAGCFDFHFNVFLPLADPIQTDRVPSGFRPISPPLDESEVKRDPTHFAPGTVITSKGIDVSYISKTPLDIRFTSMAREGGIIVLPNGAASEDLISTERLQSYVKDNLLDWYRYIRDEIGEGIPNGSLYLITGCDKVTACSNACIPYRREHVDGKTELRYSHEAIMPWEWSMKAQTLSIRKLEPPRKEVAIFLRGMRLSLGPTLWTRYMEFQPDARPFYNLLSTPVLGLYSRFLQLREKHLGAMVNPFMDGEQVPFHPSDLISQVLLEKCPYARIAIIDDSVWLSVVNGEDTSLPRIIDLIVRVFQTHQPVTQEGAASLVTKSEEELHQKPNSRWSICLPARIIRALEERRIRNLVKRIITSKD